jgi:serine/threonine-protein kinase
VSGTILAGRYRIIGLLGRGGMGEVYRADDLKLGQAVALKFLPAALATDGAMLARFHNEARIARQVTHPAVCRVHDIGEVEGQHFLSMEYIDGENLSTLLRRIGRLPADKAVEVARQLCAGLAAAHEQGVLHRDLKPSNVMLDGRGKARITDFGLAGLAESMRGAEVRMGTPAYMAPEQLTGKEVSVRSDLYALGLVLYELFTGKRVFEARTIDELVRLYERSTPTTPSSHVKEMDPLVERVIMRCLERDPEKRPASALQVATALPGGDPLQAALAAGETPSPEMVAAARSGEGALRPGVAVACLLAVFLAASCLVLVSDKAKLYRQVPLEKSPEILAERAREMVRKIGYSEPPLDTDYRFSFDSSYAKYAAESESLTDRKRKLASGRIAMMYFWYRQSPRYLDKLIPAQANVLAQESLPDAPLDVSGLTHVALDPRGRLLEFYRVPPRLDAQPASASQPDWTPLFDATELDPANFKTVGSEWVPPVPYDTRAAWEGALPELNATLRIEAAAYQGRAVYFQLIYPWTKRLRPEEVNPYLQSWAALISFGFALGVALIGALVLARHNLRRGRGDRQGAFKLASFVFLITLLGTFFGADHVPSPGKKLMLLYESVRYALFFSAVIWLGYVALEPYVRRYWPRLLISWSRLLAGEFRDPMVGRDVLVGALIGLARTLGYAAVDWLSPTKIPFTGLYPDTLRSLRVIVMAFLAHDLARSILIGLAFLFFLLLLSIILRRQWLAAAMMWLIATSIECLFFNDAWLNRLGSLVIVTLLVFTAARFGLLALVTLQLFFFLGSFYPLTTDFAAWYAGGAVFSLSVMAGLALYGFYTSLAGQSVFQGKLLD